MDTEASETPKKRERDHDNQDSVADHDDADGHSPKRTKLEDRGGDNGDNSNHNKSNGHAEVQTADHEKKEPDQASMALNPPQEEDEMTTTKAPPSSKSLHPVAVALSPALTRSRASEKARTNGATGALESKGETAGSSGDHSAADTSKRWRGEKIKGQRTTIEMSLLFENEMSWNVAYSRSNTCCSFFVIVVVVHRLDVDC
jgi:hypothetical protein